MAEWPRRITRGPLRGQTFRSEAEYRAAHRQATGVSRYAQRNVRAKALGYQSYGERRRVLKSLGIGRSPDARKREGWFLDITKRLPNAPVALLVELAKKMRGKTPKNRQRLAIEYAEEVGIEVEDIWAFVYSQEGE